MLPQRCEEEDRLRELLASHPVLLAGDEIDPECPRRWLAVGQDAALFLDQDGIPTLVEARRFDTARGHPRGSGSRARSPRTRGVPGPRVAATDRAVEVRQYASDGRRMVTSKLVGRIWPRSGASGGAEHPGVGAGRMLDDRRLPLPGVAHFAVRGGSPAVAGDNEPGISLASLHDPAALAQFLATLDWMIQQIESPAREAEAAVGVGSR